MILLWVLFFYSFNCSTINYLISNETDPAYQNIFPNVSLALDNLTKTKLDLTQPFIITIKFSNKIQHYFSSDCTIEKITNATFILDSAFYNNFFFAKLIFLKEGSFQQGGNNLFFQNIEFIFEPNQNDFVFKLFSANFFFKNISIKSSNQNKNLQNYFYHYDANLTIENLFLNTSNFTNSCLFYLNQFQDDNQIFVDIRNLSIQNTFFKDVSRLFSFEAYNLKVRVFGSDFSRFRTLNDSGLMLFKNSFIYDKSVSKLISIEISDLSINGSIFEKNSNLIKFSSSLNNIDFKLCSINMNVSKYSILNNYFGDYSNLIDSGMGNCFSKSFFEKGKSFYNIFNSSLFLRMTEFQLNEMNFSNNSLTNNSVLYRNDFADNNLLISLKNSLFSHNQVQSRNLFVFNDFNLAYIVNNTFLGNFFQDSVMIALIRVRNVFFKMNLFENMILKLQISCSSCDKIFFSTNYFTLYPSLPIYLPNYFYGGCLSFSSFSYLIIVDLYLKNLVSLNTNFVEIVRDSTIADEPEIKELTINNTIISNCTFKSNIYSISIFNILVMKNDLNKPIIVYNNAFLRNSLSSISPNQINSAVCFIFMSLNAKALFSDIYVETPEYESEYFEVSLMYINTPELSFINSNFLGRDIEFLQSNHLKIFSGMLTIENNFFFSLLDENGGALFLSANGKIKSIAKFRIKNCTFIGNHAINGGALYLYQPEHIHEVYIEECLFVENEADNGNLMHSISDHYETNLKITFCNCLNIDSSEVGNILHFSMDGNSTIEFNNMEFTEEFSGFYFDKTRQLIIKYCDFHDFKHVVSQENVILMKDVSVVNIEGNSFQNLNFSVKKSDENDDIYRYVQISFIKLKSQYASFNFKMASNQFYNVSWMLEQISEYGDDIFFDLVSIDNSNTNIIKNYFDSFVFISNCSFYNKFFNQTKVLKTSVKDNIFHVNNVELDIFNSTFYNNIFVFGSCIYVEAGAITILNSSFFENSNQGKSVAMHGDKILYLKVKYSYFNNLARKLYHDFSLNGDGDYEIEQNIFNYTGDRYKEIGNLTGVINFGLNEIFAYNCTKGFERVLFDETSPLGEMTCQGKNFYTIIQFSSYFDEDEDNILRLNIATVNNEMKRIVKLFDGNKIFVYNETNNIYAINFFDDQFQINSKPNFTVSEYLQKRQFLLSIQIKQCPIGYLYKTTDDLNEVDPYCAPCQKGEYSLNSLQSSCLPCPSFANCPFGILLPKPTYWRSSLLSSKLYFCRLAPSNCLGGTFSSCKNGSIGPKCQSCDYKNFYVKKFNNECALCGLSFILDSVIGVVFLFLQICMLFYYIYSWIKTIGIVRTEGEEGEMARNRKRLQVYLDIFGNYLQIIALIAIMKSEKGDGFWNTLLFMAISPQFIYSKYCIFVKFSKENAVYVDLMYIVFLPFFKFLLVFLFLLFLKHKKMILKIERNHLFIGFYSLFKFEVIGVLFELFSFLSCEEIDSLSYMTKDLQYHCGKTDYSSIYFIYFILIMIPCAISYSLIIPSFIFYRMKKRFNNDDLFSNSGLEKYGLLWLGFKKEFFFWEIIKTLNKILFLAIAKFILYDPAKIILIMCLFCVYAISLHIFRPYINHHFNLMEISATIVYIFFFLIFIFEEFAQLSNNIDNSFDDKTDLVFFFKALFFWVNILLNTIFLAYLGYKSSLEIKKKAKETFKKLKFKINCGKKNEKEEELIYKDPMEEPVEEQNSNESDNEVNKIKDKNTENC